MITDSDRSAELPPVVETGTIYFIAPHSMLHPSPRALRLTIGGLLGAAAWPLVAAGARWVPEPLQFLIGWFVFTIGPGFVVGGAVSRRLDRMTRLVVLLAAGSAAAPVVIDLLGRAHLEPLFPYIAAAFTGMYAALAGGPAGEAEPVGRAGGAAWRSAG